MFSKQRKASIFTTVFDSDEVQSISPSELEVGVGVLGGEEDAGERTEVESVASEKDLVADEVKSEVASLANSTRGSIT